ncbi:MAG: metallophosphoesterase [Bacteroidota bacterium]
MKGLIPLIILLIVEFYSFQAIKTITKNKWVLLVYLVVSIAAMLFIVYSFMNFDRGKGQTRATLFVIGLALITYIPKILIFLVLFIEDVSRLVEACVMSFVDNDREQFFSPRRRFVSQIALGIAAIPFSSLLYGMTIGKYNFKVIRQQLFFDDLPEEFDGTTITQISDIHSGSFDDNTDKIKYAVDLINEQNSDLLLFTGDIVNTHAKEMDPWIDTFKGLYHPKLGKYSILGNHDYGTYFDWGSEKEENQNFENIKAIHQKIDFKLMLNENVKLKKGDSEIVLVGVENWGRKFGKKGDLKKAAIDVKKEDFKILMSHDPSHWDEEVQHDANHYHLTLSGHTHGLQFGIEIPGFFKWSPVQYIYKQWAGLYENAGRYIYVNRGFGFHAYPGRVGIMPEITVIELKKTKKVA